jgi:hypothetical protein
MSTLTRFIDPSALPQSIGGTLVDETGDPECK